MLTELHISDFTLVEKKELSFSGGLTALTGETGAGKSILLGALGLALGDRADADKVRQGAAKADISASFNVARYTAVKRWLNEAELEIEEGADECLLRRVITAEGRSKAYVNGRPVTLGQLRTVGEMLVDLHSQHEHQYLLKVQHHRRLLDEYGQYNDLVSRVKHGFGHWQALHEKLENARANTEEINARYQLLRYQVEELDQLALEDGEVQALEEKQQQLAHAEQIQQTCQDLFELCSGDEALSNQLNAALYSLRNLPAKNSHLGEVESMLQNALIQIEEAGAELSRAMDSGDEAAYELPEIESRLSAIYDISRKHRVTPEELFGLHQSLSDELSSLVSGDEQLEALEKDLQQAREDYDKHAQKLSDVRKKSALKLSKNVNKQLADLAMSNAKFEVQLTRSNTPTRYGDESVEFLISTIPGQPAKALAKIASGGELSRISLAIVVVTAKTSVTPTLVFDEVDVGIGGATGDIVGRMLRELGASSQVLCVTHLAQVASKSHQHLKVEKTVGRKTASTEIVVLEGEEKVAEIARMMGGAVDSKQSLAHAREMLATV